MWADEGLADERWAFGRAPLKGGVDVSGEAQQHRACCMGRRRRGGWRTRLWLQASQHGYWLDLAGTALAAVWDLVPDEAGKVSELLWTCA